MCRVFFSALEVTYAGNLETAAQSREDHRRMDELGDFPFHVTAMGTELHQSHSPVRKATETLRYSRSKRVPEVHDSTKHVNEVVREFILAPGSLEAMSVWTSAQTRVFPIAGKVDFLAERPIPRPSSIEIAKQWISACSSSHEACSHIQDTELPTRVIDCGTPGTDPRLIQTQGMKGQYITLSHCWGDAKPPVTTAHNLKSRMLCIPYSTLPRTFRDAVDIVRELGFQFLWIDGFCIIQGDEDDWKHESALMGRYLFRSALTITGPAAKDAFTGFLHHSCPSPLGVNRALLFKFDKDATMNALVGFGVEHYPFSLSYPKPGAVAKRARVVQERLLSPRMLYFGADQAYFECNTAMNFETLK